MIAYMDTVKQVYETGVTEFCMRSIAALCYNGGWIVFHLSWFSFAALFLRKELKQIKSELKSGDTTKKDADQGYAVIIGLSVLLFFIASGAVGANLSHSLDHIQTLLSPNLSFLESLRK